MKILNSKTSEIKNKIIEKILKKRSEDLYDIKTGPSLNFSLEQNITGGFNNGNIR